MTMESEKLVIELNYRNEIIDESNKEQPFNSRKMFELLPETPVVYITDNGRQVRAKFLGKGENLRWHDARI